MVIVEIVVITKEERTRIVAEEFIIFSFVKYMLQMYCLFSVDKNFFKLQLNFCESDKINW